MRASRRVAMVAVTAAMRCGGALLRHAGSAQNGGCSLSSQRRSVLSVPDHILAKPQRAREYKIARVRCAVGFDEIKQVLQHYEAQGVLSRDEASVALNMCALQRNYDGGLWVMRLLRGYFDNELTVYEWNNFLTLHYLCWRPHDVLAQYCAMLKSGIDPNADTYTTLLRTCTEFLKRAKNHPGTLAAKKFRTVGACIVEDVVPTCLLQDGRYHLLRALHNWHEAHGDEAGVRRCRDMMASVENSLETKDLSTTSYNNLRLEVSSGYADMMK